MNKPTSVRAGETSFRLDPATAEDARLCFIGHIGSPWCKTGDCPKNVAQARERGGGGEVQVAEPFRMALADLAVGQWIFLVTWLHEARRDLGLQMPRHADGPRGTFALRSPVRPNPIGLHLVRIEAIDPVAGAIQIEAIDVLDGTPLLDIKPYFASVDRPTSNKI